MDFRKLLDSSSEASIVLLIVLVMATCAFIFAYENHRATLFNESIVIELEATNGNG